MAADDAQIGYGTIIKYSDMAGTPAYTAFAKVNGVSVARKKDFLEATTFDSTGKTREYIANLKDSDAFTMKMRYLPKATGQALIESDYGDDTLRDYQVILNQPTPASGSKQQFAFSAFVEAISAGVQGADNLVEQDVTFRISGPVTIEDIA